MNTKPKFAFAILALIGTLTPIKSASASPTTSAGVLATFEGRTIDLSKGWGSATACSTDGVNTTCYRSAHQMATAQSVPAVALAASVCIPSVNLYSGTKFTGLVLNINSHGGPTALSQYGFDNITSSYAIGYCDAVFYDGTTNTSSVYPGPTTAYSSATSMLTGWDNRISSITIS